MSAKSASSLLGLPSIKNLRHGQAEVVRTCLEEGRKTLNAQLPTGYGKTLTAMAVYSTLSHAGRVNRLLYIVPTVAQLDQFVNDGRADMRAAHVKGPLAISDLTYSTTQALKAHRNDKAQMFATTVQSLTNTGGPLWECVRELMQTGLWMIVVDEYHHYGQDAHWGREVAKLACCFRLAMSATPHRQYEDEAFGKPDVVVSYRQAADERAVKPLSCAAYVYRVTMKNGEGIVEYTTEELCEEAGTHDPKKLDEYIKLDRKMRWLPKYISPLVDKPIQRMMTMRMHTRKPLQVLIGAMCCSHAEMVCEQVRTMFPELKVDWVGTGEFGRPSHANKKVLHKFCPPKVDGVRRPEDIDLDVLVHVGMAGEGLDSVYVSEVVHLNAANINNTNNQENGRAARYLDNVTGFVNVDSSSPYAKFLNDSIMDVMDNPGAKPPDPDEEPPPRNNPTLPDAEDLIFDVDVEFLRMDGGMVRDFGKAMLQAAPIFDRDGERVTEAALEDPSHWLYAMAEKGYRDMRRKEAEQFNDRSLMEKLREDIKRAMAVVTGDAIRALAFDQEVRVVTNSAGDIKHRINIQKHKLFGKVADADVDTLKRQYQWIVDLQKDLRDKDKGAPPWLK